MPELSTDNNRGRVCSALTTTGWRDCYEVADELGWPVNGASKMLADVYRAGYVHRQEIEDQRGNDADYEYQLKENIRFK